MNWFAEMMRSHTAETDLSDLLARRTSELHAARDQVEACHVEARKLRDAIKTHEAHALDVDRGNHTLILELQTLKVQNDLLHAMIRDGLERERTDAGLLERLITVERHNATYQATTQWAVAHINAIAIERGSLIDRLDDRRGLHPVPAFHLEPPAVTMAPPPGPIGVGGIVGGVPIPEGMTAGDAINALREKREREARQTPAGAGDLLAQAASLFEEPTGGESQDPQPIDPFADIP